MSVGLESTEMTSESSDNLFVRSFVFRERATTFSEAQFHPVPEFRRIVSGSGKVVRDVLEIRSDGRLLRPGTDPINLNSFVTSRFTSELHSKSFGTFYGLIFKSSAIGRDQIYLILHLSRVPIQHRLDHLTSYVR